LQALTVLGDRIDPALLMRMLPTAHQLDHTLDVLTRTGMVVRDGSDISTSHPLLHEIVLAGIPAAARRELHSKALASLDPGSAPLEARAVHAYHAQDSFQALLLLEQVADRAAARGDTPAEILALRRGLELARVEISRGELDDPLQAVLIFGRKLGVALTRAGHFADAEGVLREALDIAGPSGTDRARVLAVLAEVAHARKRNPEALSFIDEAIETARRSGAHDLVTSLSMTRAVWAS
jgi:tetratricopeptide (TPR) repeat protein